MTKKLAFSTLMTFVLNVIEMFFNITIINFLKIILIFAKDFDIIEVESCFLSRFTKAFNKRSKKKIVR